MPRSLTSRRWRHTGALGWLLLTLAAVGVFTALGRWQWNRGIAREVAWAAADAQPELRLTGRLDGERQILLDNITRDGRAGYEVLTPLVDGQGRTWLINRGWLPFSGYRDRLPDTRLSETEIDREVSLRGKPGQLPVAGIKGAPAVATASSAWPRVLAFPDWAELEALLGRPMERQVLLLAADSGPGYARDWPRPGVPPDRHFAYAVQWWSFAGLALLLFLVLTFRKKT